MFTAKGEPVSGVNCPLESALNPLICDVPLPLTVLDTYTNADGAGGGTVAKVAMTESALLSITLQLELPEQAPAHELNTPFDPADSLSVTLVSCGKTAVHVVGQSIPGGLLVTVPAPEPLIETVSVTPGENVAPRVSFPVMVTLQLVFPEHAPLHPSKK